MDQILINVYEQKGVRMTVKLVLLFLLLAPQLIYYTISLWDVHICIIDMQKIWEWKERVCDDAHRFSLIINKV
jgi:hypothetical protein